MAFKEKLGSLLRKQSSAKSSDELVSPERKPYISELDAGYVHQDDRNLPNDPLLDAEVMDSIEKVYFSASGSVGHTNCSEYELQKLPEQVDLQLLELYKNRLTRQLQVVSKKVSYLVLENHSAYVQELQRVIELQKTLQATHSVSKDARSCLTEAKYGFTESSLALLANYRKKLKLQSLMRSLRTIKTLQKTDIRLFELLEEEDYPGAIQLCLECQKAAATYRHFKCISELSSKLQDTLEQIEEQLDQALAKICTHFDPLNYGKLQAAYRLVGKTQTSMDQLHMHFATAIHNTAFNIVLGYVELCAGVGDGRFQRFQYTDLCSRISVECFTQCLIDLCKALWQVMLNYHKTIEWHQTNDLSDNSPNTQDNGSTEELEAVFNRNYVKKKLEHGRVRIWQDMQQKVKSYILGSDLSNFKFDDFIKVLDVVNRLIQVGQQFCDSASECLQDSIRKQSLNYFRTYHRSRMDELRMFLETEAWTLCPVKQNFTILNLQEFKFLRPSSSPEPFSDASEGLNSALLSPTQEVVDYFRVFVTDRTPFDIGQDDENTEDILASNTDGYSSPLSDADNDSDDSDVPDELKQDFIDEHTGETPVKLTSEKPKTKLTRQYTKSGAPILANTTLHVLRFLGKYMQMISVLKPIAFDVVISMSQIFDYYLYVVNEFFTCDGDCRTAMPYSHKLYTTLKRIHDNLITQPQDVDSIPVNLQKDRVICPHRSLVVNLTNSDNLFGLAERVAATESVIFLAKQFRFLQSHLEMMIPQNKRPFLQQFYTQTVSSAAELRRPVYNIVSQLALNYDIILQHMYTVKWDIRDIMSQHNSYIDTVLQDLEEFGIHIAEVAKTIPIQRAVYTNLWAQAVVTVNRTFVEGFSAAKKCSNEGRALMQLDYQQFLINLDKITEIRPIPEREFVENYIKAFYLPEMEFERWIIEHTEYSTKQLSGLINCCIGQNLNKRSKPKLLAILEEIDKNRK